MDEPLLGQQLFHLLDLGVQGVGVPRPDVGLQDHLGADALVGEGHGRVAYDGHDLVPVALDLGEHRGGAVGKAALANDTHDLGDLGGQLVAGAAWGDGHGDECVHAGIGCGLGHGLCLLELESVIGNVLGGRAVELVDKGDLKACRGIGDGGGTRAGNVVDGGAADGCRKRVGGAGVHGQHAALRAAAAGDLGHERAAAVGLGHGRAVGNQVDFARDHYGAAGVAGERHGGIAGGVDRVGGVDAAHAAQISRLALKTPQAGERDNLGGIAAHDGGLVLLELVYQLGAQATDAQTNRIEHPGLAGVVCRLGRAGNRLLVDGKERAHIEIDGAAAGNECLALVGQIDHGGRSAHGELCVGDKVDRHRVGDGARHRIGGANLLHGLDHVLLKLFRIDHCTCLLGIEKGRCA